MKNYLFILSVILLVQVFVASATNNATNLTKQEKEDNEQFGKPIYGKKWRKLTEEPPESENQDFTGRLSEFITTFGNHLLTQQDSNNEVELSNHQLRSIQLSFDELPTNSCTSLIDNPFSNNLDIASRFRS